MNRVNVTAQGTDGRTAIVGWFDLDAATEVVDESTRYDGHNWISVHLAELPDKFGHQRLIRTAGGRWVLETSSQWQNRETVYEYVGPDRARDWLTINGSDDVVEKWFGEVEAERGPGAPVTVGGPPINMQFGEDLLARAQTYAKAKNRKRADVLREAADRGLAIMEAETTPGGMA